MKIAIIDKLPVFRTGVRITIEGSFGEVTTFETAKIKSLRKDLGQQALTSSSSEFQKTSQI